MVESLSEFLTFSHSESLNLFNKVESGAIHVNGATVPAASMMVASRFLKKPGPILVVTRDYKSAESWVENLEGLLGENFVRFFPSIGLKPYEKKIPFEGVLEERLKFFRDIESDTPFVTVCPLDALLMRLPAPQSVLKECKTLKVGDVLEPASLRPWFMDHGFIEQPVVSGVGEDSIRGCIVAVNCLLYPHPIRI
jgi:transcription-repair coupling factor (superfamily II helicase)